MKLLKTDKRLISEMGCYRIDGDLITDESLDLTGLDKPLFVDGSISTGGFIKSTESINTSGSISTGGFIMTSGYINTEMFIDAGGFIKAAKAIEAGGFINSQGYIKTWEHIKAGRYVKSEGCIEATAITCSKLFAYCGTLKATGGER